MKISIESSEVNLTIQLIDIPAVKRWYIHFRNLVNDKIYYRPANDYVNNDHYIYKHQHITLIRDLWQGLCEDVNNLRNIGYNFPYHLPKNFDYSQSTLNLLHRFFTYNAIWHHDKGRNPFDHEFQLPIGCSYKDWHKLIDPINDKVHKLEIFTEPTENKNFVSDIFPISDLHFIPKVTDYENWFQFTPEEYIHNQNFHQYNNINHLAILDASILGKSIFQTFCDDDDPNCKDCTGRHGSFGGFIVTANDNRKSIYQSKTFRKWCKKHHLIYDKIPLEFVIGYVTEISNPINGIEIHSDVQINFI